MKEIEEYRQYCTKYELQKALNTLHGLLTGIALDHKINEKEVAELLHWCSLQYEYIDHHPFSEIIPMVEAAIADGIVTQEEYADINWVYQNYTDDSIVSDTITSSIQVLEGILYGILADGVIDDSEIFTLKQWIDDFHFLQGTYPYDEIYSLLTEILADGLILEDKRQMFKAFISAFVNTENSLNISKVDCKELERKYNISGLCAVNPTIHIRNRLFCFTGKSSRGTRDEIAATIMDHDGLYNNGVTKKTDYLIVGDEGNPCWMFSCYGRKVEKAVTLRKAGGNIAIIHESDFWHALEGL